MTFHSFEGTVGVDFLSINDCAHFVELTLLNERAMRNALRYKNALLITNCALWVLPISMLWLEVAQL